MPRLGLDNRKKREFRSVVVKSGWSRMVVRPVWSTSVAATLVILGACQPGSWSEAIGGAGETTAPPLAGDASTGGAAGVPGELPLDWFIRLQSDIGRMETELYFGFMARCMAEAGFSWVAPESPPVPPEWEEITRYPMRYGMVTLVQAERAAYRSPEEVFFGLSDENPEENLPSDPAERQAFQAAWSGVTDEGAPDLAPVLDPITGEPIALFESSLPDGGGCQGQANQWLTGRERKTEGADVTTDPEIARIWIAVRSRAAYNDALADEQVVAVADRWRACMSGLGWDLPDWRFPGGVVVASHDRSPDSPEESERLEEEQGNTRLAVDDVGCQEEVDWLTELRVVEAGYQQETVERVPDLFAESRELLEAYAARLATLRLQDLDR